MGVSRRRIGALLVAVPLAVGLTSGTAAATPPDRADLRQAMTALVDAGLAGVQVRVHDERGDWTGSAGTRRLSGGTVPTNGHFRVGSITKTFVSTVVLQLVHEGRVTLDKPVADYLPRYGFDPRITVRMLLRHESGLFNYTGEPNPDGTMEPGLPLYGTDFVENRYRTYTPDQMIALSLSKPLRFAPGTDWSYSNTNYIVAGQLIRQVTGTPWDVQVRNRILRPLGLRETVLPGERVGVPEPHAHGYYAFHDNGELTVVDATRLNPSWADSAGEVISTTRDLDRFINALMGGRLLPSDLLAQMMTSSRFAAYGLGMELLDPGPTCGGVHFGHSGSIHGYLSFVFSTPDRTQRLEVSLTTGAADTADPAVATRIQAAMNGLLLTTMCGTSTPADATPLARPLLAA
jgi:D-alanyl-D-alanine carboxypeptidase